MDSSPVSPVSHAKRRVQAASKVPRNELPTTLQELRPRHMMPNPEAVSRTPGAPASVHPVPEIHRLSWGYPSRTTIRFIFNQGFPHDWMLASHDRRVMNQSLFHKWLRTKRTNLWCDAVKHLKAQLDPELVRRIDLAPLTRPPSLTQLTSGVL
jgi:hypothetical protein